MSHRFLPLLVCLLSLPLAQPADPKKPSALDKPTLEAYVRHLFVWGPQIKVEIGDPKPAPLPEMLEVNVHASAGQATQDELFYVSKDGQHIVRGSIYDVKENPFKADLDKLKTDFQANYGTPGAPVVLVLFSDFECPYCKVEAQMLRQNLISTYPTQVRVYFTDFPLEQLHPWARAAANGGRCVFHQDPASFWEYYDWIYSHQETITADNLKSIATIWAKDRKDVDATQLGACMDNKEFDKEVDGEIAKAKEMEITGTPTIFVNGRRIVNSVEWTSLKGTIDNEIQYQKVAKNAGEDCGCDTKLTLPGLPQVGASPIKKP
jgi:protein-disulfide isomerase